MQDYRILCINPGSTSTKIAVFDGEQERFKKVIYHATGQEKTYDAVDKLIKERTQVVLDALSEMDVNPATLSAVVGRGGIIEPIDSGTYTVNDRMFHDLKTSAVRIHASAFGGMIAYNMGKEYGIPAYVVDPIVVDELDQHAKLTGWPGIERRSVFHALNQKAVARQVAKSMGIPYENGRFIVAHMGGGITVGAHRYGRVIDVNDALTGEGPFTPERTGAIPAVPLIKLCFSGEYTQDELIDRVTKHGGMSGYLGTNDLRQCERFIKEGDEFAALVLESMAYQVSKEIGAMVAVLEGRVDAIILTGGLANNNRFTGCIKQRVDLIAPVHVFPGEEEMLALAQGALRVLRGEEAPMDY